MTSIEHDNRRKFVRHPSSLPVRFRRMGMSEIVDSDLINIGQGGIAFVTGEAVESGAMVQVSVPSIDAVQAVIAQVLWCVPVTDGFEVGLAFADEENAFKARMVEQACQIEAYREQLERERGGPVDPELAAREWIARYASGFSA